ncbi:DUF5309 domain-containing protein [Tissierella praeacuta]|uniref:DUF5309 domain-containing protein n=1 Tax=Tissierella praeacuta TaxID=43131 RepID=UPI0035126DD1
MIKTNNFTNLENIDLTKEISLVAPMDTPLFSLLMARGQYDTSTSKTINWREKSLDTTEDISQVEGSETDTFQSSSRAEKNNIMEIFKKAVSVSGTAMASDVVGISDLMASEVNDRLIEMKVNVEKAILKGVKKDGSVTPFVRKMAGLQSFVPEANKVKDATFTEKLFKDTVRKLWENGLGSNEFIALVNADLKEEIDALYKDQYNYIAQEDKFGLVATTIVTNYGNVKLVLDRHMDTDKIIIFDPEFVKLSFLRTPRFEKLAKDGDSEKGQVITEASLKVLNEKAVAMYTKGA